MGERQTIQRNFSFYHAMSQKTIGEHISSLKAAFRLNNSDSRLTDRHFYLWMFNARELLIKQSRQWLNQGNEVFQVIPNLELTDVDVVEACGIDTGCTIKRTKERLPKILENIYGPIIKIVTPLDNSTRLVYTTLSGYLNKKKKTTSKYDKSFYFWARDGYLYFPNLDWDMVSIEAFLEEDYVNPCDDTDAACANYQDHIFRIPGFMLEPMSRIIEEKLRGYLQIPEDVKIDKNNNNRG